MLHPRAVIYFYIPHKRPKPGGHISTQISYTSSLAPLKRSCAESNSKGSKKRRSYGTPRKYYPSDIVSLNVFFIPSYTLWRRGTLDYSLLIHHNRVGQTIMLRLLFRYTNLMYHQLACRIRFSFALFATYASSLQYIPHSESLDKA